MTEQQPYDVVRRYRDFELRRYPPSVVAEVTVRADFEDAGNRAFRTLFGYISGANRARQKVAMTAPVIQRQSTEIATTAPLQQQRAGSQEYAVAFVLPASFTVSTAPEPTGDGVVLRQHPATLAAARRYRGRWTRRAYDQHRVHLDEALAAAGLVAIGAPRWARYNAPYLPWFLRRNEVVQDVADPQTAV